MAIEAETDPAIEHDDDDAPIGMGQEPSIVDLLRQDLKDIEAAEDVLIPIVGYERVGLRVKYRLPTTGKELDEIANKVRREFKDNYSRNLYSMVDTMIVLCEGLYVQPAIENLESSIEGPVPLDPDLSGEPVRFDQRLAEAMGWTDQDMRARLVVRKIFGGNDMAISAHAEKLSRWLANTKADLTMEFWQLGEGI